MLQLFRNFFKSKLGIAFTLGFLALIAIAFASSDVASSGSFGGVSGGDRVAVVGDTKIGTAEYSMNVTNAFNNMRQQNPTLTMDAFVSQGGADQVFEQMLQRTAVAEYARKYGLRAGQRLVDSEIIQSGSFNGPDGSFDQDMFRAVLQRQGLTEAAVRSDLAAGLLAQQLTRPVGFGATMPRSIAQRYAALQGESRKGTIAIIPSMAFAPKDDPTDKQVQEYYSQNKQNYIRPERRVIRYTTFGPDAVGDVPAPTDAQIKARYERDADQYAASESREFTQLVLPTEAAAKAVLDEVNNGSSLAAAAKSKGLETTSVGPVTQSELAQNASAAVAQAAFAVDRGTIAKPARGGLGWYLLRVDSVKSTPARSLDQVRGEISDTLAAEQQRAALVDLSTKIEDEVDSGRSLAEIAKERDLTLQSTKPLTAEGNVYGTPGEKAPEVLNRALTTAFQMQEGKPQLAEVDPGKTFLIFEAQEITPSAAAPLKDIREQVVAAWRRHEGSVKAKEASQRIMKRLADGKSFREAMAAEKTTLPPADSIDMSRDEIARGGQVPPILALFFSMAEDTTKRLEAPGDNGWFVAQLDTITPGKLDDDDPSIGQVRTQLGQLVGDEYLEQFVKAVEKQIGTERNSAAIKAVKDQLTGANNRLN
ncbi:peptidylprolyl isomerase [Altericroceibacterium spongiae]|uniref:Parvulin-like PPIase n=1 Tax=Altericroceibacterium spongiae TaxID=2320269 RepID=A0A420ERI7_9SPHN|nr:SurA N-terminal domain-containing protein [Altericroceibacterium spongiae]RKF23299.1 peptidylprolyl isomerase [Altericroceibacterium spongiae]